MKIEIDLPIPDGWEFERLACPVEGEFCLNSAGGVYQYDLMHTGGYSGQRVIVRPVEPVELRLARFVAENAKASSAIQLLARRVIEDYERARSK